MNHSIAGIVICGGQSSRMGRPKAWLPFGDEFMLQRVVRIMRDVLDQVVVVAAQAQALPELPVDIELLRDAMPDRGPLEGLATGMRAMSQSIRGVFLSSCDVPLLSGQFIAGMISRFQESSAGGQAEIAMPRVAGRLHPLAAIYSLSLQPRIDDLLQAKQLRLSALCEQVPTRFVESEELAILDPTGDSLRNLNTPDEYVRALETFRQRHSP